MTGYLVTLVPERHLMLPDFAGWVIRILLFEIVGFSCGKDNSSVASILKIYRAIDK